MYVNSGGGSPANPFEADLYAFPMAGFSPAPNPPNQPAPALVFSHDGRDFVDSQGSIMAGAKRYLWVTDRAANRIVVVDTTTDRVVREIPLAGSVSSDPAPDLLDVSPAGNRVYMSLRGPNPLTANAPAWTTPWVPLLARVWSGCSGAAPTTPSSRWPHQQPGGRRRWPR